MSQNEEKHQVYGIPRNLKSAGKIADTIEVTNLIQGIIIALVLLIVCLKLIHLPLRYTIVVVGAAILLTALPYGKNNDSFCKYFYLLLHNFFVRKTYRRYVRYRSLKKTVKQRMIREQALQAKNNDISWEEDNLNHEDTQ